VRDEEDRIALGLPQAEQQLLHAVDNAKVTPQAAIDGG